ncbi:hypothetical protein DPMN_073515 [Dreissena polymorpha]|uniref:Uncharacterized protein n=1 Tax=Dreissena polymorpha TaxID=45954 RepID=A0A9D4BZ62_DREPO|nr:hypothetical protein DPMN_073515 [Dreissena polymorpha]
MSNNLNTECEWHLTEYVVTFICYHVSKYLEITVSCYTSTSTHSIDLAMIPLFHVLQHSNCRVKISKTV